MSLQSVVAKVCLTVGVRPPSGQLFDPSDRTKAEFVNLANIMARRMALESFDWPEMIRTFTFVAPDPGGATSFAMPNDYHRLLRNAAIFPNGSPTQPMSHIDDPELWMQNSLRGFYPAWGSWTLQPRDLSGGGLPNVYSTVQMAFNPALGPNQQVTFQYLCRMPVLNSDPVTPGNFSYGSQFLAGTDEFVLGDDLLMYGMIWQWKAFKGAPYAEDIETYEDALAQRIGRAKPSPIVVPARRRGSYNASVYIPWGPLP